MQHENLDDVTSNSETTITTLPTPLSRKQKVLEANEKHMLDYKGSLDIHRPLMDLFTKLNKTIANAPQVDALHQTSHNVSMDEKEVLEAKKRFNTQKQQWSSVCRVIHTMTTYLNRSMNVPEDKLASEEILKKKEKTIAYGLKRYVRGLATPGLATRMAFSYGLKCLLVEGIISEEQLFGAMQEFLKLEDTSDVSLGRLSIYTIVFGNVANASPSASLSEKWLLAALQDACTAKLYLRESFGRLLYTYLLTCTPEDRLIFSQLLEQVSAEYSNLQPGALIEVKAASLIILTSTKAAYTEHYASLAMETYYCQPRLHFLLEHAFSTWRHEKDLLQLWSKVKSCWMTSSSYDKKYSSLVFLDQLLLKLSSVKKIVEVIQGVLGTLRLWADKPSNMLYKKTMQTFHSMQQVLKEKADVTMRLTFYREQFWQKYLPKEGKLWDQDSVLAIPLIKEVLDDLVRIVWQTMVNLPKKDQDNLSSASENENVEEGEDQEISNHGEDNDSEEDLGHSEHEHKDLDSENASEDSMEDSDVDESTDEDESDVENSEEEDIVASPDNANGSLVDENALSDSEINAYYDEHADEIDAKLAALFRAKRTAIEQDEDEEGAEEDTDNEGADKIAPSVRKQKRIVRQQHRQAKKLPFALRSSLNDILLPFMVSSSLAILKNVAFQDVSNWTTTFMKLMVDLKQVIVMYSEKNHFLTAWHSQLLSEDFWKKLTLAVTTHPESLQDKNLNTKLRASLKKAVQKASAASSHAVPELKTWLDSLQAL